MDVTILLRNYLDESRLRRDLYVHIPAPRQVSRYVISMAMNLIGIQWLFSA